MLKKRNTLMKIWNLENIFFDLVICRQVCFSNKVTTFADLHFAYIVF